VGWWGGGWGGVVGFGVAFGGGEGKGKGFSSVNEVFVGRAAQRSSRSSETPRRRHSRARVDDRRNDEHAPPHPHQAAKAAGRGADRQRQPPGFGEGLGVDVPEPRGDGARPRRRRLRAGSRCTGAAGRCLELQVPQHACRLAHVALVAAAAAAAVWLWKSWILQLRFNSLNQGRPKQVQPGWQAEEEAATLSAAWRLTRSPSTCLCGARIE